MTNTDRNPSLGVAGKSTVVIGGTSGIGKAISKGFAADGAAVVATSRRTDDVKDTASELREMGADTIAITCDVTDRSSIKMLFKDVNEKFGDMDVLVNSAGVVSREPFVSTSETDWKSVIDVQLHGVYRSCQEFIQHTDAGSIINISSILATHPATNLTSYSASKAGVNGLTRSLARELAPDFRVNAIAPGYISTPINRDVYAPGSSKRDQLEDRIPLQRMGKPEDIVGGALYLASDASAYTTGAILTIDGGVAHRG